MRKKPESEQSSHNKSYLKNTITALAFCLGVLTANQGFSQQNSKEDSLVGNQELVEDSITKKEVLNSFCSVLIEKYGREKATGLIIYYMIEEINTIRQENGLQALKVDQNLSKIAQEYAQYLADNNHYSHIDLRGQTPSDRAKKAGYKGFITGENISPSNAPGSAIGKEERNLGWMGSKGHRENILNPDAKSVGLGYVNIKRPPKTQGREETEYNYFVMIFGSN